MPEFTYRPLAYITPSGLRLQFDYDGAINDGVTHNLGEFQFAGTDEKYFQDRSISSNDYPFTILLNNQDDLRTVRAALNEKGSPDNVGTLEHPDPTIGSFPALVSAYNITQNSVNGIGIIRINVIFFKTIPNLIGGDPSEASNPAGAAATRQRIDSLNEQQAQDFSDSVDLSTGRGFASLVESITSSVENAQEFLGSIAAQADQINILFTNTAAEILSTADELARAPFDLARQMQNLIQLPMLAVDSVRDRVTAYKNYIDEVLNFTETETGEFEAGSPAGANILSVAGLSSIAAVSAVAYSGVSGKSVSLGDIVSGEEIPDIGYLSRRSVIDTIHTIEETARESTEILSQYAADFGAQTFFGQYFDYSILNKNLITAAVRNLNNRIFDTNQEIIITNEKEENVIPICAKLYNSVEVNTVRFFVESNGLHGDEIYLVPKNRELVYYS